MDASIGQALDILRSCGRRYIDCTAEKLGSHQVYILTMSDGTQRCLKLVFTEYGQQYEDKYRDLEYIGLVPRLFDCITGKIELHGYQHTVLLLVNEVVESVGNIEWSLAAIDKLHANGYIHGDVTEPSNIAYSGGKALFLDIDGTFHVDDMDSVDVDFEEVYGTRNPEKIMASERRVIERRIARSIR